MVSLMKMVLNLFASISQQPVSHAYSMAGCLSRLFLDQLSNTPVPQPVVSHAYSMVTRLSRLFLKSHTSCLPRLFLN